MPERKTLSARAVIADIKVGMGDDQLMEKYGISTQGLHNLKIKLIQRGLITQQELENKGVPFSSTPAKPAKLPAAEIAADINAGMLDNQIVTKYGISAAKLPVLYAKLVEAGFLQREGSVRDRPATQMENNQPNSSCPECGKAVTMEDSSCAECGHTLSIASTNVSENTSAAGEDTYSEEEQETGATSEMRKNLSSRRESALRKCLIGSVLLTLVGVLGNSDKSYSELLGLALVGFFLFWFGSRWLVNYFMSECYQFGHKWKRWKFDGPQSCIQIRTCSVCKNEEMRALDHKWSKWEFKSESSCEQLRSCKRCKEEETRTVEHNWTDWEFISDNSCQQQRTCNRCSLQEKRQLDHNWGHWDILNENCKKTRSCSRCGEVEEVELEHDFSEPDYASDDWCNQTMSCTRCGKEVSAGVLHRELRPWEKVSYKCKEVRKCGHCGEVAIERDIEHAWGAVKNKGLYQVKTCRRCKVEERL